MYSKGIFVFGSKIFYETTARDAITALPLELSWKIFSYLDEASLVIAYHAHKTWSRIIDANKKLRKRLNYFELADILGSKRLAKFYRRNKKIMKKEKRVNYLATGVAVDQKMKKMIIQSKRQGEDIVVYTKRFKLF